MPRRLLVVSLIGLVATASLGAKSCSCRFTTAKVTESILTDQIDQKAVKAKGSKDVFPPTQPRFYYVVTFKHCPSDTKITAVWKYLGGPTGSPKPQEIDRSEKKVSGSGRIAFSLNKPPGKNWPVGRYEVQVLLDDKVVRSKEFQVKPGG